MSSVKQRTAVVTGAVLGIGKAIARQLASEGSRVEIFDINREAMKQTVLEINRKGWDANWRFMDVSRVQQVQDALDEVIEENESIDVLVNNAGVLSRINILDLDEEEWNRVMDCNVRGAVFMTQSVLKHMIPKRSGRIVNISSMSARNGGIKTGVAYSISKAALIGLTKRTARFAAEHHITVNCVEPGPTLTDIIQQFPPEERELLESQIPIGELSTPQQAANAVSFLASESSRTITGVVLDVNGGMHL